MDRATCNRLIEVSLENSGGKPAAEHRDKLMFAIGEQAGVWPESSRDQETAAA